TVCVVGKIRDLILQLSKSSIYSTKPPISNVHAEFTMIQAFLAQFATAETNFIYSSHPPSLRQQAQTDLAAGLHITFIFTDRHQNNKYDIY
ncbi:hypothetical protein R1M71_24895, partial [Klebsiella sp. 98340]|uniref:hypothetical protein n=1 Tax=Klebsiella sp. 98340 TaxID=3079164 RepID=UPI0030093B47